MPSEQQPNAPPNRPKPKETFSAYINIVGPVFYNRDLSDKAKLLYGILSAMTQPPNYYAYARNSTLCKFLNCSERTLQRYLKELLDCGEVRIEDGEGGRTLRKIKVARLQPFYPDKFDGVTPTDLTGVHNIKNNKKKKEESKEEKAMEDISPRDWLRQWACKLEGISDDDRKNLVADLDALLDARKAKRNPVGTVRTAGMLATRLLDYSRGEEFPVLAMRYMLQTAALHGWASVNPIDTDFRRQDFLLFAAREAGWEVKDPDREPERGDADEWV